MNNYVPLTKEDVFFIDDIDGTTPKNIEFVPLKRLMSAVCWRNNLQDFAVGVDVQCAECHDGRKWVLYTQKDNVLFTDGDDEEEKTPFPIDKKKIWCSVCATNKAFGIEVKK